MKRGLLFLLFFIISLALMACNEKDEPFDAVFKENLIVFADGDSATSVTQNLTLMRSSAKIEGATIRWESDDPQTIRIDGERGIVTRNDEDTKVTLTAIVTIDNHSRSKDFVLIVKGKTKDDSKDEEYRVSSTIIIEGTKDWELRVNDPLPNFLSGVKAKDLNGENVEVSIIANTVDPSKIGDYVVIYEAKKGDQIATTISSVSVLPKPTTTEWIVETFTGVPNITNKYDNFTHVGVNTIEWSINYARTDIPLDGDAITFRGRTNEERIVAQISGGIQKFKADVKVAYGGDNDKRVLELLINDEMITTFELDLEREDEVQQFVVDNLQIEGEFTLELRHQGAGKNAQVTVDNISWLPMVGDSDGSLPFEVSQIKIPMRYTENGSITLPTLTDNGNTITWSYADEKDANNRYIDLKEGKVILPDDGKEIVRLVATVTDGNESASKRFTVVVGKPEVIPIQVVKRLNNGATVHTVGIVTDYYVTEDRVSFFFEDNTAGILVKTSKQFLADIKVGSQLEIRATKTVENNQPVLVEVTNVKVICTNNEVQPKEVENPADLIDYVGNYVRMNGLIRQEHPDRSDDYWFVNEYGSFQIVLPADLPEETKTHIHQLFANKEPGLEVTVEAGVAAQGGRVYLYVFNIDAIELNLTPNVERMKSVIIANFTEPVLPDKVTDDLSLPESRDLLFDALISWSSSHEDIISSTGKLIAFPTEDKEVTLSYVISLNDDIIYQGHITVVVPKRQLYSDYYKTLEGLTGNAFKRELSRIISQARNLSYGDARYILPESDADPKRPENVLLVYNRASVSGKWDSGNTWNREHVWPQSKLNGASDSDLHNLKPADPDSNNDRGNYPFCEGDGGDARLINHCWYPGEEDRGDIARIIFYMHIRYGLSISQMGELEMFIRWHYDDPVDDFERNRNDVIYHYQNNRNPFIDHPEFVAMLFEVPYHSSTAFASYRTVNEQLTVQQNYRLSVMTAFPTALQPTQDGKFSLNALPQSIKYSNNPQEYFKSNPLDGSFEIDHILTEPLIRSVSIKRNELVM